MAQVRLFYAIAETCDQSQSGVIAIRRRLLELRAQAVNHSQRLVGSIARRIRRFGLSFDDRFQSGTEGLMRAFDGADLRGAFSTYAYRAIERAILRLSDTQAVFEDAMSSLDTPSHENDSNNMPHDRLRGRQYFNNDAEEEGIISGLGNLDLTRVLEQLSAREHYVIAAYYGLYGSTGLNSNAIAAQLGVSRQTITAILDDVLPTLRSGFEGGSGEVIGSSRLASGSMSSRELIERALSGDSAALSAVIGSGHLRYTKRKIVGILARFEAAGISLDTQPDAGSAAVIEVFQSAAVEFFGTSAGTNLPPIAWTDFLAKAYRIFGIRKDWSTLMEQYRAYNSSHAKCPDALR